MKRHLVNEATDRTFCHKPIDGDRMEWTYKRGRATCPRCLSESKPDPPLPNGHAAKELARLRQQNALRNGIKIKLRPKQRVIERRLLNAEAPVSATLLALELDWDVSDTIKVLVHMWNAGAVRKTSVGYRLNDPVQEPMPFVGVDPESWMRRGIRNLKGQMFN